jgi:hypothetical protein
MTRISTHFKLKKSQRQLDFVDVCLETDNMLFIDPKLIEQSTNTGLAQMKNTLQIFSKYLFDYVRRRQRGKASELFKGISEPNETRLGYSNGKPQGNSMHGQLSEELLDSIFTLGATLSSAASLGLGNIEIFIKGVSCDRISDTVTKIIKADLIDFTQAQCAIHSIPMVLVPQKDVYDGSKNKWEKGGFELPVFDGKPIIFVPKSIVRRDKDGQSTFGFFFRFAFRNFIKTDPDFTQGIPKKGRDNEVTKKDFFKNLSEEAIPWKEAAEKWVSKYPKILREYKSALISENRFSILSDKDISDTIDLRCKS